MGRDVSAVTKDIDAGLLPAHQNPTTRRWQIKLEDYVAYEKVITSGRPLVQLPDPQQATIGAVRQAMEPMLERIFAELAVMNRRLAAFDSLLPPEGGHAPKFDRLAREEEASIAVNRDRTTAMLTEAAAQVAETKRRAGITR